MNGYLKANYLSDGVQADTPATGVSGSAFDGITITLGAEYPEIYPDNITAIGGSTEIIKYSTAGRFGGIAYSGNFGLSNTPGQLIYVGFGVENSSKSERNNFMQKALTYFNVNLLGIQDAALTEKNPVVIYPNPFNSQLNINFYTKQIGIVSIKIMDLTGKILKETSTNTLGSYFNTISIEVESLPKGFFLCELKFPDGQLSVAKIVKK
jgi:hypothetical protein